MEKKVYRVLMLVEDSAANDAAMPGWKLTDIVEFEAPPDAGNVFQTIDAWRAAAVAQDDAEYMEEMIAFPARTVEHALDYLTAAPWWITLSDKESLCFACDTLRRALAVL